MTDKDEYIYHNRLVDLSELEKLEKESTEFTLRFKKRMKERKSFGEIYVDMKTSEEILNRQFKSYVANVFYEVAGAFKDFNWAVYRNVW